MHDESDKQALTPGQAEKAKEYREYAEDRFDHYKGRGLSRKDLIKKTGAGALLLGAAGSFIAACGGGSSADDTAKEVNKAAAGGKAKGMKMFATNGGLVVSWFAQGKRTMEHWADVYGVDLTWADGELDATKQRAKVDNAATKKWDLVAVTAQEAGTLVAPLKRMVDNGAVAVQMISEVGKPGEDWGYTTWVEQSSYEMGYTVADLLFKKAGGKGTVIETQGPASFTGAQQRHKGFEAALKNYPDMKLLATDFGNWDPNRARSLWDSYINKYDDITVGYFHNDDMAFAGLKALESAGRDGKTFIGGADAMPEAIQAVADGRFVATFRHSAARIHMYPVVIGVAKKLGLVDDVPKKVVVDGLPVTTDTAASLAFLQSDGIFLQ
jgi:ribose transport system substrate-binding protein